MKRSFSERVKAELSDISEECESRDLAAVLLSGGSDLDLIPEELFHRTKTAKAFLRGVFLYAGTLSDPAKAHHLEISFHDEQLAGFVQTLLSKFHVNARILKRRSESAKAGAVRGSRHNTFVLYIKEAEAIANLLAALGAGGAYCEYENAIILRGLRNKANRQANCDSANTDKAVETAARQLEAIKRLEDTIGLDNLPPILSDAARMRLEHADLPIGELAALLTPPVGKSGANHRLRKLEQLAGLGDGQ
jgi:DNA-binding protein WhiA